MHYQLHLSFGQFVFKVYLILLSLSSLIFLQSCLTSGDKGFHYQLFWPVNIFVDTDPQDIKIISGVPPGIKGWGTLD